MTANFMDIFTPKGYLHSQIAIVIASTFKSESPAKEFSINGDELLVKSLLVPHLCALV